MKLYFLLFVMNTKIHKELPEKPFLTSKKAKCRTENFFSHTRLKISFIFVIKTLGNSGFVDTYDAPSIENSEFATYYIASFSNKKFIFCRIVKIIFCDIKMLNFRRINVFSFLQHKSTSSLRH